MCTLTLYKNLQTQEFIITQNRDESPLRPTEVPKVHQLESGLQGIFPKDLQAGGSWIGVSRAGYTFCLLNGALKKHSKDPKKYTKSRGGVITTLLSSRNFSQVLQRTAFLVGMEPFTLVSFSPQGLVREYIWDGDSLRQKSIDANACIWSSSTLYGSGQRQKRKKSFDKFCREKQVTSESIRDFHQIQRFGEFHGEEGIFIKRERVETVSTTQIIMSKKNARMDYIDYLNLGLTTSLSLDLTVCV